MAGGQRGPAYTASCRCCVLQHPKSGQLLLATAHTAAAPATTSTNFLPSSSAPPMATRPYFLWGPHGSTAAPDSDVAGFSSGAPETALVSPELGAAAVARPRLRRNSSTSGKQQQQPGEGTKKPPQRGLGVAELERLRCGGDPLRELVELGDGGAQAHPLLHYHHHLPASAFEGATGAHYSSPRLQVQPSASAPPLPPGPVCYVHPPVAGGQRAPPLAPEQQYLRDRWGRMGGFSSAGNGVGAGADRQTQLLPPLAPEHPSSQSTIWRPPASSSSCLHTGHRCDLCSRTLRAFVPPTPPASQTVGATTNTTMPEYIYDLAAAMATARQGGDASFLVRERKRGAEAEAPVKKEVREIEFFPAARTHHAAAAAADVGLDESEFAAPLSSSYGARAAPPLDLSLRL
ncbi:uncharacterized protein LOC133928150 [Phragmites australis]|uniref:uncharacterized protein LOC133928150 n=1 Tax=Phragmites australis TaxID=29695 RepID=UPI002D7A3FC5|nr:uncharacterized protein LOC133928150 [Phragmites australis]